MSITLEEENCRKCIFSSKRNIRDPLTSPSRQDVRFFFFLEDFFSPPRQDSTFCKKKNHRTGRTYIKLLVRLLIHLILLLILEPLLPCQHQHFDCGTGRQVMWPETSVRAYFTPPLNWNSSSLHNELSVRTIAATSSLHPHTHLKSPQFYCQFVKKMPGHCHSSGRWFLVHKNTPRAGYTHKILNGHGSGFRKKNS